MKKLLVILHIYYHNQVDWFLTKLSNIRGVEWDLIITHSDMDEALQAKIKEFKADTKFIVVENVGYDVWPFIKTIKSIDLSPYDYIIKLHTKNIDSFTCKINGLTLTGTRWRNILVDGLLRNNKQFRNCIDIFRKSPKVGMICSYEMCVRPSQKVLEDTTLLMAEAKRIGLKRHREPFCAGTMFMIRPICLKPIINADLSPSMWGNNNKSHSNSTLAHVYERIFGTVVSEMGYQIKGISAYHSTGIPVLLHKNISPLLKSSITINYAEDGNKYLFLLGKKVIKF